MWYPNNVGVETEIVKVVLSSLTFVPLSPTVCATGLLLRVYLCGGRSFAMMSIVHLQDNM